MAKNLKLHVKNTQLAEAINLKGLKAKLSRKKGETQEEVVSPPLEEVSQAPNPVEIVAQQENIPVVSEIEIPSEEPVIAEAPLEVQASIEIAPPTIESIPEPQEEKATAMSVEEIIEKPIEKPVEKPVEKSDVKPVAKSIAKPVSKPSERPAARAVDRQNFKAIEKQYISIAERRKLEAQKDVSPRVVVSTLRNTAEKLGPVLDKEVPKKPVRKEPPAPVAKAEKAAYVPARQKETPKPNESTKQPANKSEKVPPRTVEDIERSNRKAESEGTRRLKQKPEEGKNKLFKKGEGTSFDARRRHGVDVDEDDERGWRKRKLKFKQQVQVQEVSRPTKISVRLPISVKDLAAEMKLKASELISKLFMQGVIVTLNDQLDEELVVQLLGQELGCEVTIDTREEERVRITGKTIAEEIAEEDAGALITRSPIIAFMGHVDHGKTSLIDAIRKSNRAASEVGAITQHIGAFMCQTENGPITIIDTPGHEAFSAMRIRGAEVTDIVVLVIAGDEGIQEQTIESIKQAKEADSTIVVAINKCDKSTFDQDLVFRQLADQGLLPESWGGATVTVACSALTHQGIPELLEMLALQSEVLELKANPQARARGTVIESEMSKGQGPLATVLVQNGTLHVGDCVVFGATWARIKSMRDENNKELAEAGPSTPARISGISGVPAAGEEFIVVKDEKEAKDIAEARREGQKQLAFQTKRKVSFENMMEKASSVVAKKILTLILRADVQGSLEAVKTALFKIESQKVELNIISLAVGEISESDLQLAAASKASIIGFHTSIEAHAEPMVKELGVQVRLHDIIYHAQDDVKAMMKALLDKIPEEKEKGKAEVRALFKSSQLGVIAGCQVIDGSVLRNCRVRVKRNDEMIWSGPITSLKRVKEDIKEATKGSECGIFLQGFSSLQVGDILEAYEVIYLEQDL